MLEQRHRRLVWRTRERLVVVTLACDEITMRGVTFVARRCRLLGRQARPRVTVQTGSTLSTGLVDSVIGTRGNREARSASCLR
jgi:hypothetical protein